MWGRVRGRKGERGCSEEEESVSKVMMFGRREGMCKFFSES